MSDSGDAEAERPNTRMIGNIDEKEWARKLASYKTPKLGRSLFELTATVLPFAAFIASMLIGVKQGYWTSLLLIPAGAFFLVRLFLIQHDCGHGSFFKKRWANDALGRILSVLTFTPYGDWQRAHAKHHATSGNLDRRGTGDIDVLTVAEYRALSFKQRLLYRLSRNPFVLLAIAPAYVFLFRQRLPNDLANADRAAWISTMSNNLAIITLIVVAGFLIGFGTLLAVLLPVTLGAAAIGLWLFYVQHQFEHTYWARENDWTFHEGALHGSTHYDLPAPFSWLTSNIGIHHVHHLVSRIPSYRLHEVLRDYPELKDVGRLTFFQSLKCFRLSLWDEKSQRLIGFRAANALP